MVIAEPASELLALVRELGDRAPADAPPAARRRAELVRRRFGLALPPPFAGAPAPEEPVRVAVAADGAAIAAIKWRAFGTSYRGVLPEAFLDGRDVVPPAGFWTGRAMVPPSRRHRLLVWGRPGTVHGYLDAGPADPEDLRPDDPDPSSVGEVFELYVDPSRQSGGGGSRLLREAESGLGALGFERLELSVLVANVRAQAFYEAHGWERTERIHHVDLGVVAFDEVRYVRAVVGTRS